MLQSTFASLWPAALCAVIATRQSLRRQCCVLNTDFLRILRINIDSSPSSLWNSSITTRDCYTFTQSRSHSVLTLVSLTGHGREWELCHTRGGGELYTTMASQVDCVCFNGVFQLADRGSYQLSLHWLVYWANINWQNTWLQMLVYRWIT